MKKTNHEKIKSLRLYHATMAAMFIFGILFIIFIENPGAYVYLVPICMVLPFGGKWEKEDELAKLNIGKANTVTMWLLMSVLIYFGMYARFHEIRAIYIMVLILAALAVRSVVFLIFDSAFTKGNDSNA